MGKLNEAFLYIDSALTILKKTNNSNFLFSSIYNNLACIYSAKHMFDSAYVNFQKSIAFCKTSQNTLTELENYKNLAEMYDLNKQYDLQIYYLKNITI